MASITLATNQKVPIYAEVEDSTGAQVAFTAPPVFLLSDSTIGDLVALTATDPQPAAGFAGMMFVPKIAGNTTVSVSEDAVLGDDTTKVSGTLDIVVTAVVDLATSVVVTSGTPA